MTLTAVVVSPLRVKVNSPGLLPDLSAEAMLAETVMDGGPTGVMS